MDFELIGEQRRYRNMTLKFAEKEVKPAAKTFDRKPDPRDCFLLQQPKTGGAQP